MCLFNQDLHIFNCQDKIAEYLAHKLSYRLSYLSCKDLGLFIICTVSTKRAVLDWEEITKL